MPRARTPPQVFTSGLGLALEPLSAADLNSPRSVPSFSHLLPLPPLLPSRTLKKRTLGAPPSQLPLHPRPSSLLGEVPGVRFPPHPLPACNSWMDTWVPAPVVVVVVMVDDLWEPSHARWGGDPLQPAAQRRGG